MADIATDILIIGGGPAGASAAISLLNYTDLEVVVVEQSALDGVRVGEHVSGSIFDLVDYLKIDRTDFEPETFAPSYGLTSYWGKDQAYSRESIFTSETSTYQLDREKFDLKLLKQIAERGGDVFPRTQCVEMNFVEDRWQVTLKHPDEGTFTIEARFLVDATGRKASICRRVGVPDHKLDELVGVGTFLECENPGALPWTQVVEATELGWWYAAVLPQGRVSLVFFSDANLISQHRLRNQENWMAYLKEASRVMEWVGKAGRLGLQKIWVRNAFSHVTDATQHPRFLAIGDAACAFDPISSMGIGFAMTSAFNATRAIHLSLKNDDRQPLLTYQQDIAGNFASYQALRTKYYSQEQRWPEAEFWTRRWRGDAVDAPLNKAAAKAQSSAATPGLASKPVSHH